MPRQRPEAVQQFKPALGLAGAAEPRAAGSFSRAAPLATLPDHDAQALGPELASARRYGKERLLTAILEPNADVRRDYLTYVVETVEGES